MTDIKVLRSNMIEIVHDAAETLTRQCIAAQTEDELIEIGKRLARLTKLLTKKE